MRAVEKSLLPIPRGRSVQWCNVLTNFQGLELVAKNKQKEELLLKVMK